MTIVRTDIIPNLYANPIASITKADPAVVTVPVIAAVISATGTIGTVTGSGTAGAPWTAEITAMSTSAGLVSGNNITATAGTGTFAAGGVVSVARVSGNKSITIYKVGGTIPTAGSVTNITLPAVTTMPITLADESVILFTNPGNRFTFNPAAGTTTGTFVANEIITQATSGATGVVTDVFPTFITYTATGATPFNTTNLVTGSQDGATAVPTAVTGMNQLLTAGINGTNAYYVDKLTANTFALYTDSALTETVDSSAFTTATANAGQYTTFDTVEITIPTP
ncbi:hypothetical protein UFOVP592_29 [uncultured Caudovirales phage]|uniref:Uncharacterized protein n=1 Tax=uncultured Caudovirales phage TaxID=2100421 RepID=A0A6J5N7H1_9CAUD|nr:hypothetical protein UFOVP592_29 [uncultured Caudovirales phage]